MQDDGVGIEDVLVVDDNPADCRFIEEAFEASALDPEIHIRSTRDDAMEFLSQWRHGDGAPNLDLVLLDWNLSRTTGEEVLEAAKSGDNAIPVIVITGSHPNQSASDSSVDDADLVLEKPTDPETYINAVRSVLTSP